MKKILVANMTKRLEALLDLTGEFLAGKSVNVIETTYDPHVLLCILNSEFMSKYYERRFHGKKLAGGYLQVGRATLEELPIPETVPTAVSAKLQKIVIRLIEAKKHAEEAREEHGRTTSQRLCRTLEKQIEDTVRELYQ